MVKPLDTQKIAAVKEAARRQLPGGMSLWQEEWCTSDVVMLHILARGGDVEKAGVILAEALRWREEFQDVLTGIVVPKWQGELRVLARGVQGHPIIYGCARDMPVPSTSDMINHVAAVLESAVQDMTEGAETFDVVADLHGFRLHTFANPRPLGELMRMLQVGYRARLRRCLIVDAPRAFSFVWRLVCPLLKEGTRQKIQFVSYTQAREILQDTAGADATATACRYMDIMRRGEVAPIRQPTELFTAEKTPIKRPRMLLGRLSGLWLPLKDDIKRVDRRTHIAEAAPVSLIAQAAPVSLIAQDAASPEKASCRSSPWWACCSARAEV